MEPTRLKFIAEACGAELANAQDSMLIKRIVTDSRTVQPGDLFVALQGDKFDGHDFVNEVLGKGAVAAVVERSKASRIAPGKPLLVVESTRPALGKIARSYREQFDFAAIAVGGSNGKTSTKELLAAVLRQKFPTVWSEASFNNDIGVPLTLLKLEKQHAAGVFEVGTNHPGELAPLVAMVQPRYGVITSIGREHLEFFKDLSGVVAEEGALADAVPASGKLFLNGDGPGVAELSMRTKAPICLVGRGKQNKWQVLEGSMDESGTRFQLKAPDPSYSGEYKTTLLGMHQAVNAAFAVAVGKELRLGRAEIQRGLDSCGGAKMRLQVKRIDDLTVLDDSYNANADSMRAALETLNQFPCKGRRIALLGDMAELGERAEAAHTEIGHRAAEGQLDLLLTVGHHAETVARAARSAGLHNVSALSQIESAVETLANSVHPGDVILVKASRSTGLERVVEGLQKHFDSKEKSLAAAT